MSGKHQHHPSADEWYQPKFEAEPTDHAPGTDEKIAAMAQRVRNHQPVFCEGDRDDCDGLEPGEIPPKRYGAKRAKNEVRVPTVFRLLVQSESDHDF